MAALGQAMVRKRKVGKVGSLHHALRTRGICDTIFSCSKCEAVAEVGRAGVGDRGCRLGKGRARGFWERLNVKVYLVGGHCSARGCCVFGVRQLYRQRRNAQADGRWKHSKGAVLYGRVLLVLLFLLFYFFVFPSADAGQVCILVPTELSLPPRPRAASGYRSCCSFGLPERGSSSASLVFSRSRGHVKRLGKADRWEWERVRYIGYKDDSSGR